MLTAAVGLLAYVAACQSTPPPPRPAPTLSLEEMGIVVAGTMAAEAAIPVPIPTATELPPTVTPLPIPTETPTPVSTPTVTLPAASEMACVPKGTLRQVVRVLSVTDGDTVRVEIDGQSVPVRYIGIDTPEVGQPFASEATAHNTSLVMGKTATLVKDVSETDQFGRLLRYVLVGDVFVNHRLVRDGYAFASTYAPDVACSTDFAAAQSIARTEGRGQWVATPTPGCDPAYPDFCIPSPPPDLDCADIGRNNFTVLQPDPHGFDGDRDGRGCEVAVQPPPSPPPPSGNCHPSYPDVCIPPPPPDLDCGDISYRRFRVVGSDPHRFDGDNDGIGCESG